MRNLDFSSWQTLLSTLLGLAVITLIGVGIRLLVMQTIQQRRERENRQINERLRTLIAAYKTLGGSFTGNLAVDPSHLRDLRRRGERTTDPESEATDTEIAATLASPEIEWPSSDRSRRIRDAVEAALSDIVLLGTEEQVRLAALAATELAAGRPAQTAALVVSLRNFIRQVLGWEWARAWAPESASARTGTSPPMTRKIARGAPKRVRFCSGAPAAGSALHFNTLLDQPQPLTLVVDGGDRSIRGPEQIHIITFERGTHHGVDSDEVGENHCIRIELGDEIQHLVAPSTRRDICTPPPALHEAGKPGGTFAVRSASSGNFRNRSFNSRGRLPQCFQRRGRFACPAQRTRNESDRIAGREDRCYRRSLLLTQRAQRSVFCLSPVRGGLAVPHQINRTDDRCPSSVEPWALGDLADPGPINLARGPRSVRAT